MGAFEVTRSHRKQRFAFSDGSVVDGYAVYVTSGKPAGAPALIAVPVHAFGRRVGWSLRSIAGELVQSYASSVDETLFGALWTYERTLNATEAPR